MKDAILCIDIGTTSLKAALLTDDYKSPFVSRQFFSLRSECVALEWFPALKNAVSKLKAENPSIGIEAVCVSGNGPTIISQDGTTLLYNTDISDLELKLKTKSLFIPRIKAFKALHPLEWEKSDFIFSGPEFLLYMLTENPLTILPESRYTTAYWSLEELLGSGFSENDAKKLPPFVPSGSFAGKITQKAALETGLLEGTFVFAGGPDFIAALLGTGTVTPGTLCDRAGSSEGLNLCTTKPIFEEGIRTLPSVIPGLWNASVLLDEGTENTDESIQKFTRAVSSLKAAAEKNGEYFPPSMTVTGGQAHDSLLNDAKEKASKINIRIPECKDAELVGDLILARVALGDYDDIEEAAFCLVKYKDN